MHQCRLDSRSPPWRARDGADATTARSLVGKHGPHRLVRIHLNPPARQTVRARLHLVCKRPLREGEGTVLEVLTEEFPEAPQQMKYIEADRQLLRSARDLNGKPAAAGDRFDEEHGDRRLRRSASHVDRVEPSVPSARNHAARNRAGSPNAR